jgi:hypothetical protein
LLFTSFVLSQQNLGLVDVALLSTLGSTAKQNDEHVTFFGKVNPIAWPQSMMYSPMPSNHLMLDVLPNSMRSLATVTLAAACTGKLSNQVL